MPRTPSVALAVLLALGTQGCGEDAAAVAVRDAEVADASDVVPVEDVVVADEVSADVAEVGEGEDAAEDAAETALDVAPDAGPVSCGDCDDLLDCTADECGADGVCRHVPDDGFCAIAGACVEAGAGSPCQVCAPAVDPHHYTSLTGGPCDDADPCTLDDACHSGICRGDTPVVCPEPDLCHVALGCGPEGCTEEPRPDGAVCAAGKVCEAGECIEGDPFPVDTVAFFDRTTCPSGWALADGLFGRTAVAVPPERVGEVAGTALANGEDRTHVHVFTATGALADRSFAGIAGGGLGLARSGAVALSVTGAPASAGLPYLQLLPCRKTAVEERGDMPLGLLVQRDAAACPAGWAASVTGYERLVVGTPEGGAAGASFGATTATAHSHGGAGTVPTPSQGVALVSGCCSGGYASAAGVAVTLASDAATVELPWRGVLQCEVPVPLSAAAPSPPDAAPPGMVLWSMSAACPPGWSPHAASRGRLHVGAGLGGDVGLTVGAALGDREDRVHTHAVSVAGTLTQKNIAAAAGGNRDGAAPGAVSATLGSGPATSGLRFLQRTACVRDTEPAPP